MHICPDEIMAFMGYLGHIPQYVAWCCHCAASWWRSW